jgi:5-oxoprolinase (ATP-hydrolysing) subunit A
LNRVDLNVDIGEGFPNDEALLEFATSANVCCGEHAGSLELTLHTVELCLSRRVRVGAHPGFPDRESMGRRTPNLEELESYAESLVEQPARVKGYQYIKPHGAFYNILVGRPSKSGEENDLRARSWEIALDYCRHEYPLMLLDDRNLQLALRRRSMVLAKPMIREGFADRAYLRNGTLVPRSEPGAVLHDLDEVRRQVLDLATKVDSICLHGDTPNCLEYAELVTKTLLDAGYEVGC